jgi:hypothetical protein
MQVADRLLLHNPDSELWGPPGARAWHGVPLRIKDKSVDSNRLFV